MAGGRQASRPTKSNSKGRGSEHRVKQFLIPLLALSAALSLILRSVARSVSRKSPDLKVPAARAAPYEAIDAYIEREMRRLKMPGVSLAIVEGDQIAHQRCFGRARPGGEAPTPQTPFFIGSLAKSFTALAVMQLVEAGKVDLDSPIQRYLPWFRLADPSAAAQITVRHLLNQTSGLPVWTGDVPLADFDSSPGATKRQAQALASLDLARPAGAACDYNNMNYNLLGLIIEAVSGDTYAGYLQEQILHPLGLSHTYASKALATQHGLAVGHRYWFGIPFAEPDLPVPLGSLPSGQLISTAEDMAGYLIAHLNGGRGAGVQLLSAAGVDQLHQGALEYRRFGISAGRYAMGWFDGEIGQTRIVWHSGTTPDFNAYMAIFPEQKKGIVLLFNASHFMFNPILTEVGMGAAGLLAGETYRPTPAVRWFPWIQRGQLLIPAAQMVSAGATVRSYRRWRQGANGQASMGRDWGGRRILPHFVLNLLASLTVVPTLGKTRGYLMLFMPDFSWIARTSGSLGLVWSIVYAWLLVRTLRGSPTS
jgi:CubicO group peptidase (beta-lactamase class C family)